MTSSNFYIVNEKSDILFIALGAGGGTGGTCPQDFAIDKEVSFLFQEMPLFLIENVCALEMSFHPQYEMLRGVTSLTQLG